MLAIVPVALGTHARTSGHPAGRRPTRRSGSGHEGRSGRFCAMSDIATPASPASPDLPAGGSVRPITRWGQPVMHRKQDPITEFDDDLAALVADMAATMYAADGVGLAACQIGVD